VKENEERSDEFIVVVASLLVVRSAWRYLILFNNRYVFMGEEISMSARLWTAGYDIFSPTEAVMGHIYVRRHKPKFWESVGRVFHPGFHNTIQMLIIQRIKHSMGYPEAAADMISPSSLLTAMDEYGLGEKRTLKDYMAMVGLDTQRKKVVLPEWCHKGQPPPGFEEFNHLYAKGL